MKLEEAIKTKTGIAKESHAALADTVDGFTLEARAQFAEGERMRNLHGQGIMAWG